MYINNIYKRLGGKVGTVGTIVSMRWESKYEAVRTFVFKVGTK